MFRNICLAGALLISVLPAAAQKTDIIYFTNGDRLTCEIKRLRRGVLEVSVEAVDGSLRIDWRRISRIESDKAFEFRLSGGKAHIGEIRKSEEESKSDGISVLAEGTETELSHRRVIEVLPIGEFGGKLDIEVDGGLSYTKGNNQTQYTANAMIDFTTPRHAISGTVRSLFSGQTEGSNTNRHNFTGHYIRFVGANWGVHALADFLVSDQQQLDLRSTAGIGVARDIWHTQQFYMAALGGAVWNNENYSPSANVGVRNSAEAQLGFNLSAFRFKKLNFETTFWLFPSLSETGRVRTDWRNSLKVDLPHDLYWRFGLTLNLDNRPPPEVPGTDLVTTTTLGWEF